MGNCSFAPCAIALDATSVACFILQKAGPTRDADIWGRQTQSRAPNAWHFIAAFRLVNLACRVLVLGCWLTLQRGAGLEQSVLRVN